MLDKTLKISIIIATYNRVDSLGSLLDHLSHQYKNFQYSEVFEIILVNNNSNDNTKGLVASFSDRLPIKYIEERTQGLCRAQNTGILESNGNLICFIDDDVIPGKSWLEEVYRIAYYSDLTKPQGFCGKIKAKVDSEIPEWLSFSDPFSITPSVFPFHDYGDEELRYPFIYKGCEVHNPIGANFIFTKKVFEDFDLFREDLGAGSQEGFGKHGDTEFTRYLLNNSVEIFYKPSLTVTHPVDKERVSKEYIRAWYKKSGFSLYWLYKKQRKNFNLKNPELFLFIGLPSKVRCFMPSFICNLSFFNVPMYILLKIIMLYLAYFFSFLLFKPKLNFWLSAHLNKAFGEAIAARKLAAIAR